jgi:hypothetical protein
MFKEIAILVIAGVVLIDLITYIKEGGLKYIDSGKN